MKSCKYGEYRSFSAEFALVVVVCFALFFCRIFVVVIVRKMLTEMNEACVQKMDERLPARKERRHRQKSHVLTVDDSVYHLWRGLASREGLNTDSAVATFLLKR